MVNWPGTTPWTADIEAEFNTRGDRQGSSVRPASKVVRNVLSAPPIWLSKKCRVALYRQGNSRTSVRGIAHASIGTPARYEKRSTGCRCAALRGGWCGREPGLGHSGNPNVIRIGDFQKLHTPLGSRSTLTSVFRPCDRRSIPAQLCDEAAWAIAVPERNDRIRRAREKSVDCVRPATRIFPSESLATAFDLSSLLPPRNVANATEPSGRTLATNASEGPASRGWTAFGVMGKSGGGCYHRTRLPSRHSQRIAPLPAQSPSRPSSVHTEMPTRRRSISPGLPTRLPKRQSRLRLCTLGLERQRQSPVEMEGVAASRLNREVASVCADFGNEALPAIGAIEVLRDGGLRVVGKSPSVSPATKTEPSGPTATARG